MRQPTSPLLNKSVVSWLLYDISNTVFNFGVVGVFLSLWINVQPGTTDADLGNPVRISNILVLIISPFLGTLTDQFKGRVGIFTLLNVVAAIATFWIGFVENVKLGLIFFCVAYVCIYLAELLYNAMLSDASTPDNRGKVGGLGIAIGYIGCLFLIYLGLKLEDVDPNYDLAFHVIGIIILLATLPITFFFSETTQYISKTQKQILISTREQIIGTLSYFRDNPVLLKFFIARFFYMTAVLTSATFAVMYGTKTIGFSAREVQYVFLFGSIFAIPGAYLWGILSDRIGPSVALRANIAGWVFFLTGAVSIPAFGLNTDLWWPLGCIIGFCFGGLWAAERPLLIKLTPNSLGEMFGIYGAISRLATILGTSVWINFAVTLGLGQVYAVFVLLVFSIIGLLILLKYVK